MSSSVEAKIPTATNPIASRRHDTSVELATNGFNYEDVVVRLIIGNEKFNVSRSRLTQRSPIFRDMFSLPQPPDASENSSAASQPEVVLHDDPADFAHYLWFIHSDIIDVIAFEEQSYEKSNVPHLTRWSAVARIAHKYQAFTIAAYAMDRVLHILQLLFSGGIVPKFNIAAPCHMLLRATAQWGLDTPQGLQCRAVVRNLLYRRAHCDASWGKDDISDCLADLETFEDFELLSHAYFYILVYRSATWADDRRLRPIDKLRILYGSHSLCQLNQLPHMLVEEFDRARTQDLEISSYGRKLLKFFDAKSLRMNVGSAVSDAKVKAKW